MSAPDTNTEKQAEQHKGPLTGMLAAVIFALVLLAGFAIYISTRGGAPEGAESQVDGRTGEAAATDGAGASSPAGTEPAGAADDQADPAAAAPMVAPEAATGADASLPATGDDSPEEGAVSAPAAGD